jgi:hypothetical protein
MNDIRHEQGHEHFLSGAYYAAVVEQLPQHLEAGGEHEAAAHLREMRDDFLRELQAIVEAELREQWRKTDDLPMAMVSRELLPINAERIKNRLQEMVWQARRRAASSAKLHQLYHPPFDGAN